MVPAISFTSTHDHHVTHPSAAQNYISALATMRVHCVQVTHAQSDFRPPEVADDESDDDDDVDDVTGTGNGHHEDGTLRLRDVVRFRHLAEPFFFESRFHHSVFFQP